VCAVVKRVITYSGFDAEPSLLLVSITVMVTCGHFVGVNKELLCYRCITVVPGIKKIIIIIIIIVAFFFGLLMSALKL
jgi:hypothetical protein